ncbi:MAG: thioredoxin-disulfide reductase [Chloroflexi bacterium]|nr:thioredoxin-disulfide reductase [Chloroflexota bacterium]
MTETNNNIEKVIIIGSGPAGFTAALYAARAELEPLVFTGDQLGGQVAITHEVENYPGFVDGIGGPEMVQIFQQQAERFGARTEFDFVSEVDFSDGPPFTVKTRSGKEYKAWSIIVSTGASPRQLEIPGENDFLGRGVSYCGTCDGAFFKGKDVIVVGGGDSAIEEGIFLTRYASRVRVIHRRAELRAKPILQTRAFNNEKMSFIWNSVVEEIVGDGLVQNVKVRNVETGEIDTLETEGVFIFIGHIPNSWIFKGQLDLDDAGYLITDDHMRTNIAAVFAAGEIQDPVWRQVATCVGQGTMAGMAVTHWIEELEDQIKAHSEAGSTTPVAAGD